jgi:hypothetical protein
MGEKTDKANWQRLNEMFAAALELDTGDRAAFLNENCSATNSSTCLTEIE